MASSRLAQSLKGLWEHSLDSISRCRIVSIERHFVALGVRVGHINWT